MNQVSINQEIRKQQHIRDEATAKLAKLKEDYRLELVTNCTDNLMKILNEEGTLSKRDMEIYIKNLSSDVRNLYS